MITEKRKKLVCVSEFLIYKPLIPETASSWNHCLAIVYHIGTEIDVLRRCCQYPSPMKEMASCHMWLEGLRYNQRKSLFFSSNFQLLTFIFFLLLPFCSLVQIKFCVEQNNCLYSLQSDGGLEFLPNKNKIKWQLEPCGPAKQIFLEKSRIFLKCLHYSCCSSSSSWLKIVI